jgi:hypothetical protein
MIEFLRSHFADVRDATIDTLLRHLDNERIADQRVTMWITLNPLPADSFLPIGAQPIDESRGKTYPILRRLFIPAPVQRPSPRFGDDARNGVG